MLYYSQGIRCWLVIEMGQCLPEGWNTRSFDGKVFNHQNVDLGTVETANRIDWIAHDRFAPHVERSVENDWTISAAVEFLKQGGETRISVAIDCLNTS